MSADAPKSDPDRLVYAGLLGLGTTAVFGLVGKPLDGPLKAALILFAAGIPLLAGCLLAAIARARHAAPPSRLALLAGLAGCALPVCGLGAFFLHYGQEYAGTFAGVGVLTALAARRL